MISSELRSTNIFIAAGFAVETKIPLNPPLLKGDFPTPPLEKGGRGDFSSSGVS
jgi:hypothetical protein